MFKYLISILLAATAITAPQAQTFPSRAITIIVPYGNGSGSDTQARLFGAQLARFLGQAVLVENKPGANGALGFQAAKALPADGYTLVMGGGSPMLINPLIVKQLGYNPNDFIHISGIARGSAGYVVGATSSYKTLDDAVAAAARERRPLLVGTYGALYEVGAAWLGALVNIKVQNVAYKGGSQVVADLVGGHLELALMELSSVSQLIKEGKLRILALTSRSAVPEYPPAPLVKDRYPNYVVEPWTSMLVRADTPPAIVAQLSRAMQAAFKTKEVQDYFASSGLGELNFSSAQMKSFHDQEGARYKTMVDAAKVVPR